MEKYHGTTTDEEWDILSQNIGELNANGKFEISMLCAVMNEMERVYEAGTSKTQGDFKPLYHLSFERAYKIARRLFFYTQSPNAENWRSFSEEFARLENPSDFERGLMKVCFKEFFGVHENDGNAQTA
jgi:hypothetical protein